MKPDCPIDLGFADRTLSGSTGSPYPKIGQVSGTILTSSSPCWPSRHAALAWLLVLLFHNCCCLHALEWNHIPSGRFATLAIPSQGRTGFTHIPASQAGITFTNSVALERHLTNQIHLNGSGVAAGDVDGDGWCDIFFAGLDNGGRLYRNLGAWQFRDITSSAFGSTSLLDTTGAAFADVDGDGDFDLILNSLGHGTRILFNDGLAHFSESPLNAGLNAHRGGMSSALADIDGDGDLDLYVANYRAVTIRDQPETHFRFRMVDGKPTIASVNGRSISDPDLADRFEFHINLGNGGGTFGHDENGEPDALFLNDGKGHFAPLSFTNGMFLDESGRALTQPPFDWGLSVAFRDLNGDGAPDIFVCNDFKSPDRVWLNDRQGHFRAAPTLAFRHSCFSSMGVDFADINRDGLDDIFAVDMLSRQHTRRLAQRADFPVELLPLGAIANRLQYARNTLFLNRGDGTYSEIAQLAGLEATEWSWTPVFLDVDLDGYEDLLISTGFERDNMHSDTLLTLEQNKRAKKLSPIEQLRQRRLFPRLDTPNLAFRNARECRFVECSQAWGFDIPGVSQGMALADLDNDGDLDVILTNLNGPPILCRNETTAPRVSVYLKGQTNTQGIGAKLRLLSDSFTQSQEMQAGGRYLSSDQSRRTFAALSPAMSIQVTWRSGQTTTLPNVLPNRLYEIHESAMAPADRVNRQ